MDPKYSSYYTYVSQLLQSGDIQHFKRHPAYTGMLEHVSKEHGQVYLENILTKTTITIDQLKEFAKINDSIGNPNTSTYMGDLTISPTSLRYIWQAHLILSHFKTFDLPFYNIVEIGGGYGGLYVAINYLHTYYNIPIQSYTICDLPAITQLQSLYISKQNVKIPFFVENAYTFGESIDKENLCVVGNYSFSEITLDFQKQYITKLFPRVKHGFFAWNTIPVYDFGFPYRVENEVPHTGPYNCIVYF